MRFIGRSCSEWNGTEVRCKYGIDRCFVSFVPAPFIGSSGGGIAQVVHRSAVEQVVTLTFGANYILSVFDLNIGTDTCCRPRKTMLIFGWGM